jgi:hypothetical protein
MRDIKPLTRLKSIKKSACYLFYLYAFNNISMLEYYFLVKIEKAYGFVSSKINIKI